MGTYIHFTDEQKERANSVDLEEFLRQRGEKLLRAGRESRLARVHHITVRGNEWYDHIARHIPPQSQSGRSRLSPSPCLRPTPICAVCTPT